MQDLIKKETMIEIFNPIKTKIAEFVGKCNDIVVTDSDSCTVAESVAKESRDIIKLIKDARLELTRPLDAKKKEIMDVEKKYSDDLDKAVAELREKKIKPFRIAEEKKRQEEIRRIQEAERKAEEERRKKEEEQQKLEEIAQQEGFADDFDDEAPFVPDMTEQIEKQKLQAQRKALESQKPKSLRMVWTFEIADEAQIPREYMIPNEKAINDAIKSGIHIIPGLKIFQKEVLNIR